MQLFKKSLTLLAGTAICLMAVVTSIADTPSGSGVIVLGDAWVGIHPANVNADAWNDMNLKANFADRSSYHSRGGGVGKWLFYGGRTSGSQFTVPAWSWPFGEFMVDFDHGMGAVEYNPSAEFAAANTVETDNPNYAWMQYNKSVPGAGDPTRDYHNPPDAGANLENGRNYAWYEAGWPTSLGVDVKMKLHSWTIPYGNIDDFHIIEYTFTNTGEADLDGDGVVDLHNNRINALVLSYSATVFSFRINRGGRRSYAMSNNRYRGWCYDMTPDENGYPWDIMAQGYGSSPGREDIPGLTNSGFYCDFYNAATYLGAKTVDADGNITGDKMTIYGTHTVGEGAERGWYHTVQSGQSDVSSSSDARRAHIGGMGSYFADGGKGRAEVNYDLNPNPNFFASGTAGDPTTFVPKAAGDRGRPDGAYDEAPLTPFTWTDRSGNTRTENIPMDPEFGRVMEPGVLKAGVTSEYAFNGNEPYTCFGPISMEVGETVKVYFVRGSGFRLQGARAAIKAARTVFSTLQTDGTFQVPEAPDVPEVSAQITSDVRPIIKWSESAGADGYKIYKASSFPLYDPLTDGMTRANVWWKTNDPNNQATPEEASPHFTALDRIKPQGAEHWGPYDLVANITAAELASYENQDGDAGTYKYAWLDETDGTLPGFTFYYYVAAYKNGKPGAPYADLESDVNWVETGKVNVNGRTGLWEETYPWATANAFYPDPTDSKGRKNLGVQFVLVSATKEASTLALGKSEIKVRPNPYKRRAFHDVGTEHKIFFFNLPSEATITIFDVAGQVIDRIDFQAPDPTDGTIFWDMFSKDGAEVASGLYLWVAEFEGGKQSGYFSILR